MGIILQRKIARRTERLVYPPVPSIADWAFLKPSLAQKIVLDGVRPRAEGAARAAGGGRGIRTPEGLSTLTVFKTAAFDRSAIPPPPIYPISP